MMTYVTVDSDTETGSEVEVIEEISTPRNTNKIMFFFYAYLALKKIKGFEKYADKRSHSQCKK